MRYLMLTILAVVLVSPMMGCESNSKDQTSHNPITGTTTHTHESSVNGTD